MIESRPVIMVFDDFMEATSGMEDLAKPEGKFCINCAHCKKLPLSFQEISSDDNPLSIAQTGDEGNRYQCIHPSAPMNQVTGKPRYGQCSFERSLAGRCGPAGNNFERSERP